MNATVYGPASATQIHAAMSRPRRKHHWWVALGLLVFVIAGLNVLGSASQGAAACQSSCPPPAPPHSVPVSYGTIYRSSQYGFSLAYDANYAGNPTTKSVSTIAWQFALKSGGYLDAKIYGSPSNGLSPTAFVASSRFAGFGQLQSVYPVPDAEVGYVPGSGEVYQGEWTPLMGSAVTERMAILAAVRKDLAITVICEGPKATSNDDHPDPSDIGIGADQFCDQVANTIKWPR